MPVEKESKIGQWIGAVREGWPAARGRFDEWKDAVRAEPVLIWETAAVRYAVYGLGAFIVLALLVWGVEQFQPPDAAPPAETANFHVLCAAAGCGHHFIINEDFDFDDFPVGCPKCARRTGQRAMRCVSQTCRSRWVAPSITNDAYRCPACGASLGPAD